MAKNIVAEIRNATRRKFSAEDKIQIVLEGLRAQIPVSQLGRQHFLLAPDHEVFERVVRVAVPHEPVMHPVDIIDKRDIEVGVERLHLVVVECVEQAMPPAESGVRVDDNVAMALAEVQHIFKDAAAKIVEPRKRQIEDFARTNVGRFGIHHGADVGGYDFLTLRSRQLGDTRKKRLLVQPDLSGYYYSHGGNLRFVQAKFNDPLSRDSGKAPQGRSRSSTLMCFNYLIVSSSGRLKDFAPFSP